MQGNNGNGLTICRKTMEKVALFDRETGKLLAIAMITDIDRNKVRLNLEAPQSVEILRHELACEKYGADYASRLGD